MFFLDLGSPAFLGAAGAFIYGAPRLSACIFGARQAQASWVGCGFEFCIAVSLGIAGAWLFSPWIAHSVLKATDPAETRAIAATIGLLVNPVSPLIVEVLGSRVVKFLKGSEK
jgi:hypothetical protein